MRIVQQMHYVLTCSMHKCKLWFIWVAWKVSSSFYFYKQFDPHENMSGNKPLLYQKEEKLIHSQTSQETGFLENNTSKPTEG